MWGFFAVLMVCVLLLIGALLRRYCMSSVPVVVRLITAYAWLVSFSIVVLVPIDVYRTLASRESASLGAFWNFAFWSTQLLTWLLLPFFQYYADAGDFSVKARCMTSLRDNMVLIACAGAAGALGIIVLLATRRLTLTNLPAMAIGLSNTFALSAGILLLGYGLVEVPRHMWKSSPEQASKWCAHRAGRHAAAVMSETKELEAVVNVICANQRQMSRRDPLRPYMDVIAAFAEAESPVKPSAYLQRSSSTVEQLSAEDLEYNYDLRGLADLRRRLMRAVANYATATTQYRSAINEAFELESICKCRAQRTYEPPGAVPSNPLLATIQRHYWHYKCVARPAARRAVAGFLAVVAFAIVWSEATIFTGLSPDLSPFSRLIRALGTDEFGVQLMTLLPLLYMCAATYTSLFKFTAFNYNKLVPGATTGPALMQNGSLMCRFAAPTCWNFLHVIHMDVAQNDGQSTVFRDKMGAMQVLPVLGDHLNVYLPIILVVQCGLIWARAWDRLLCCGGKYKFTDDDTEDAYTERGRILIRREAEARERGLAVGEVLAAVMLELDQEKGFFGTIRKTLRKGGGWFGRKGSEGGGGEAAAAAQPPLAAAPPPVNVADKYAPSAASGAGRPLLANLLGGRGDTPKSTSSDDAFGHATAAPPPAAPSAASAGASGSRSSGGGLDGIFASVASPSMPPGGASRPTRVGLVVGKPIESDTAPMLGKFFNRSS